MRVSRGGFSFEVVAVATPGGGLSHSSVTLELSTDPICFDTGSVVLMSEGEWTSEYGLEASLPAYFCRTRNVVSFAKVKHTWRTYYHYRLDDWGQTGSNRRLYRPRPARYHPGCCALRALRLICFASWLIYLYAPDGGLSDVLLLIS